MKTALLYQSRFGTTKLYVDWLKQDLGYDAYTFKNTSADLLSNYDTFIVSSGTYMGKMPLTSFLQKNWDKLNTKKIIAMAVGIVPPNHADSLKSYNAIPGEIRNVINYFKLPGKIGVRNEQNVLKANILPVVHSVHASRIFTMMV